jgi:hypothetical protein
MARLQDLVRFLADAFRQSVPVRTGDIDRLLADAGPPPKLRKNRRKSDAPGWWRQCRSQSGSPKPLHFNEKCDFIE